MEWYKFLLLGLITFGIIFFCGCDGIKKAKDTKADNSADAAFEKFVAALKEQKLEEINKFITGNLKLSKAECESLKKILDTFKKQESSMESDTYVIICGDAELPGKGKTKIAFHWKKSGDAWLLADYGEGWEAKEQLRK